MEDNSESANPTNDGEQRTIGATQHFIQALLHLRDDMRKALADLDTHLSTMTGFQDSRAGLMREIEDQLKDANRKITIWQSNRLMIWDSGPEQSSEYLQAVEEVRMLTESLGSLIVNKNGRENELHNRAHGVLQLAMERLEEELIHILQSFDPQSIFSQSYEMGLFSDESIVLNEDDQVENCVIDLVHPDVMSDIKSIANVMFASNYDQEFIQIFTSFWKETLDEYLIMCKMEILSIEEVLKMDWNELDSRIRRWCRAIKTIIRFYLPSEKRVFDQILGGFGSVSSNSFVDASNDSMFRLLNFGEAIVIGPNPPERLLRLIKMYEVLDDLLQDIDALYSEEVGSFIRIEFHSLLSKLGDSARVTFLEFGNHIALKTSKDPFPNGGIPQITKYVMNYFSTLPGYEKTLNFLLGVRSGEGLDPSSCSSCPMACQLRSVASILETNLEDRSKLYKDDSLSHIFMMNNIHYMVEKVKNSELRRFFGDEWIKIHIGKFKQHETSYERATWSPVLTFLRDDGNSGKRILRERCKNFGIAFEEIYKSQTGWSIPDVQLRDDVQISTTQRVILAYRDFMGRNSNSTKEKYMKYTEDELVNLILHFFEGLSRSLNSIRRK